MSTPTNVSPSKPSLDFGLELSIESKKPNSQICTERLEYLLLSYKRFFLTKKEDGNLSLMTSPTWREGIHRVTTGCENLNNELVLCQQKKIVKGWLIHNSLFIENVNLTIIKLKIVV